MCFRGTPVRAWRSALTARRWLSVRHTRRADHPVSTAINATTRSFDAGAVYVFTRKGEHWVQQAYVKASNPRSSAEFGHAVTLSADGNTMVVSAFWEPSNAKGINGDQKDESIPQAGAVYVFTRRGTTWTQQAYIKASNTGEAGTADAFGDGDQFGFSIALSGDGNTLAVGALTEDSAATGINGNQADNSAQSAGAVYVFTRTGTTWSQQAYVKSAQMDAGDLFGYAVALTVDGNILAVGAFDEDGSARTINGPTDNRANGSGAAYVFTRTGTTWAQQAYIKPSNGEAQDSFGVAVALNDDGTTLLVGSLDEDCDATGVNAAPCDNDQKEDVSMGAAYVFVRSDTTWSQQAFMKASNTGFNDWFGSKIALNGDGNIAVIGASLEDSNAKGINGNQKDESATEAGAGLPVRPHRHHLDARGVHQGIEHGGVSTSSAARSPSTEVAERSSSVRAARMAAAAARVANRPTTRSKRPAPPTSSGSSLK